MVQLTLVPFGAADDKAANATTNNNVIFKFMLIDLSFTEFENETDDLTRKPLSFYSENYFRDQCHDEIQSHHKFQILVGKLMNKNNNTKCLFTNLQRHSKCIKIIGQLVECFQSCN